MAELRAVARLLPSVAGKVLDKKGLGFGALIAEWNAVVGPELARRCAPVRLAFPKGERTAGTLHLEVLGAHVLEVQHEVPTLIERLNRFFGHGAVASVKLARRASLSPTPERPRRRPRPEPPPLPADFAATLEGVADPALRASLAEFGRWVAARAKFP